MLSVLESFSKETRQFVLYSSFPWCHPKGRMMEIVDIKRLQQEQSLQKIQELALVIGGLITEHAREFNGMVKIQQTNGIDNKGLPYSEVTLKGE